MQVADGLILVGVCGALLIYGQYRYERWKAEKRFLRFVKYMIFRR